MMSGYGGGGMVLVGAGMVAVLGILIWGGCTLMASNDHTPAGAGIQ